MTLNEAIEKAGYECVDVFEDTYYKDDMYYTIYEILLDPLFWQSLGKAMGWGDSHPVYNGERLVDYEWKYRQHRFIDHLADGKSIESFFEQLT